MQRILSQRFSAFFQPGVFQRSATQRGEIALGVTVGAPSTLQSIGISQDQSVAVEVTGCIR
jgi:hypothetical protein